MIDLGPSITIKADTIEEAVQTALTIMNCTIDEVAIDVLSSPRSSLFGLRKQLAEVTVSKKAPASPPDPSVQVEQASPVQPKPEPKQNMEELMDIFLSDEVSASLDTLKEDMEDSKPFPSPVINGEDLPFGVWIDAGIVYVNEHERKYPVISPGRNVKLMVNGIEVKDRLAVSRRDHVKVSISDDVTSTHFTIHLIEQNTVAMLIVIPGKRVKRTIQDAPLSDYLSIEVQEETIYFNDLKRDHIFLKLQALGIERRINESALQEALTTVTKKEIIVAKGIPPQQGKDGDIEVFLEDIFEEETVPLNENERVDFRETHKILNVEEGTVIAKRVPAVKGIPGQDLFGNVIPPKDVYEVIIRTGKNTTIKDDEVVAISAGRPTIEWRGKLVKVDVIQEFIHNGDVGMESGNIYFHGDVRITGDVLESMKVEAAGRIYVKGTITKANLQSGQSIHVSDNVFSSTLSVGRENFVISELVQQLKVILKYADNMFIAINQLMVVPSLSTNDLSSAELNHLLRLLFEKKYTDFRDIVQNFVTNVRTNSQIVDEEWVNLSERLYQAFIVLSHRPLQNIADYEVLTEEIRHIYESHRVPPEPKSLLCVPYAINSSLYCSGNIIVNGHGVYHSLLKAGNDITVSGVCRGGEIHAGRNVTLDEVGSEVGVKTVITVPADGVIRIGYAHPNTNIQIGNRLHAFASSANLIMAKLDADGNLQIT